MRTLALALAVTATASVAHADDKKYSLADLKTLVADRAYLEAYLHVGDVAPTQRNAEWIDVAATASAGVLATLPTEDGSTLAMTDTIDRDYPQLLKSTKYTKVRAELGLKGLAGCYRSRATDCARVATKFVEAGDRKLALDTAKVTVTHGNAADAVAMFKRGFDAADKKALCQDAQLQRAVVAGLDRPADSTIAGDARGLMNVCWDGVKDAVMKAFDEASKGSDVHDNTCDVLKAKRMLSSLQTKRCK